MFCLCFLIIFKDSSKHYPLKTLNKIISKPNIMDNTFFPPNTALLEIDSARINGISRVFDFPIVLKKRPI